LQRQLLQCLLALLVAYGSYFAFSNYFIQSVRVTGVSMHPTLRDKQHCFLNRWIFHVRSPRRGEVVVLRDPADQGLAVKRVIGLEGDIVTVHERGEISVNGRKLREPYLTPETKTFPGPHLREQTFVCHKDEFVVMGDNRMNSADSRSYGTVLRANILGLVVP
jgi:signal peptidase I